MGAGVWPRQQRYPGCHHHLPQPLVWRFTDNSGVGSSSDSFLSAPDWEGAAFPSSAGPPCPWGLVPEDSHTDLCSPRGLLWILSSFFCCCCLFAFCSAVPAAHGGSQARGPVGAVAAGLRQSHSSTGSEPRLRPRPQLTATPDH